jgi:hypothetical protein
MEQLYGFCGRRSRGREAFLYTGNPVLAGAFGGFVGNVVKQTAAHGGCLDPEDLPKDTVLGGLTGLIPGAGNAAYET